MERVKFDRDEAWERIRPQAELFGYKREEYDLSNTVKKISCTTPTIVDGLPKIKKHTEYLERPFTHTAKLNATQRAKLPLPLNSVSKWVGLTNFPVNFKRSTFRDPLGYWDGFALHHNSTSGSNVLSEADVPHSQYTLVGGSYDTNLGVLRNMASNNWRGPSVDDLLKYSFERYDKFGFPDILSDIKRRWLSCVNVNPDAFPGIFTSKLFKGVKRRAYPYALTVARDLWDKIVTSKYPLQDMSLWAIGGRPRRQNMADGGEPRSRLILMPEMSSSFIAGIIGTMWNMAFKLVDKTNAECFMGQEVTNGMWKRIADWADEHQPVMEVDWTEYDSTLTQNALVAAFCLLRTCFPKSRKIDKLFLFVMSGTIHTHVVLRQRFIYRFSSGLPSGSALTSIIGTIANWCLLNYTLMSKNMFGIKSGDDFGLAVAGDDTLIKFYNYDIDSNGVVDFEFMDGTDIANTFKDVAGLKTEVEDINFCFWGDGGNSDEAEFAPSLLKTTIWHGIPGRRCKDLVKVLSCPERRVTSYLDVNEVLKGLSTLPIYTPKANELLHSFSSFIGEMVKVERNFIASTLTFDVMNDVDSYNRGHSLLCIRSAFENALIVPWYETKLKLRGVRPMPRVSAFDEYFRMLHPT